VGTATVKLSYSAIDTYETCPAKFRFRYQDRVPAGPSPILAFGDSLHRALHRFHSRPVPVAPSLPELLGYLDDAWVVDGTSEAEQAAYREHARQVLTQYHRDNAADYRIPAALEFRFGIEVEGVTISGAIDRMDRLPGGGYEIIDYKTNRRLPPRSRVDADLQLSIYHLAAWEIWGIEPERLTLYYLLPGQRMTTSRTLADVDTLRRRIAAVAERIEQGRFEPRENPLCGWCDYRHLCPLFRHRDERGDAPPRIAEAIDEWIDLKREDRERWRRLEELAAVIRAYAEEHGLSRLHGSDAAIQLVRKVDGAPDSEEVRRVLEPLGLYGSVLSVDPGRLDDLISGRSLPPSVEDALLASEDRGRTKTALYLREKDRSRR
jgi:putative RecB family exonuclease